MRYERIQLSCLGVSIAVTKHMTKNNLGRKGFIQLTKLPPQSIAEPKQDRGGSKSHEGMLRTGSLRGWLSLYPGSPAHSELGPPRQSRVRKMPLSKEVSSLFRKAPALGTLMVT